MCTVYNEAKLSCRCLVTPCTAPRCCRRHVCSDPRDRLQLPWRLFRRHDRPQVCLICSTCHTRHPQPCVHKTLAIFGARPSCKDMMFSQMSRRLQGGNAERHLIDQQLWKHVEHLAKPLIGLSQAGGWRPTHHRNRLVRQRDGAGQPRHRDSIRSRCRPLDLASSVLFCSQSLYSGSLTRCRSRLQCAPARLW